MSTLGKSIKMANTNMESNESKTTSYAQAFRFYLGPTLILLLAFAIFSFYVIITKVALTGGTSPLVLALLREVIAVSILYPYGYFMERRKPIETRGLLFIESSDFLYVFLLGLTMGWGTQLLSAISLKEITPLNYALFAPLTAPMCLCFSVLLGYEYFNRSNRASWLKVAGIVIAVIGGIITALTASAEAGSGSKRVLLGNIFLFLNKVSIALYPIIEKKLLKKYPPVIIVANGYATGAFLTLLSIIPSIALDSSISFDIPASGWWAILYSGVFVSSLNYSLMIFVNQKLSPAYVMMFYPMQAVFVPTFAYFLLGSSVSPYDLIGGFIIIAGLFLCVYAKFQEAKAISDEAKKAPVIHPEALEGQEGQVEVSSVSSPISVEGTEQHDDDPWKAKGTAMSSTAFRTSGVITSTTS
jgi:drug/metabolite transporter (DMT)-like permease